jgi:shikimate kinase
VGALAAADLGVRFVDLDVVIERLMGKSVTRIFADDGEAAFRAVEARAGAVALQGPPCVLAPGGGFILDPVTRDRLAGPALTIYLRTSPAEAARRLAPVLERPLLAGADAAQRLQELLDQREAVYRASEQQVTTDGLSARQVADRVVTLALEDAAD